MFLKGLFNMIKYDNINIGGLWLFEQKIEKYFNFKGKINVDGKDYYIFVWFKVDKNGGKYLFFVVDKLIEKEFFLEVVINDEVLLF